MEYANLGATGLRVSRVCLGMMSFGNHSERPWVLDEDAAEPIVRAAADGGVIFFDTADVYSAGASEVATGRLLGKLRMTAPPSPQLRHKAVLTIPTTSALIWRDCGIHQHPSPTAASFRRPRCDQSPNIVAVWPVVQR